MKKKFKVITIVIISIIAVITTGVFAITRNLSYMMEIELIGVDIATLNDGSYTGTYERGRFTNTLTVHMKNQMIVGINLDNDVLLAQSEVSDDVFRKVIEAQSTDIDAISGATVTTKAYLMAIENALNK